MKYIYLFMRIAVGIFQHTNMIKQQIHSRELNSTVTKA